MIISTYIRASAHMVFKYEHGYLNMRKGVKRSYKYWDIEILSSKLRLLILILTSFVLYKIVDCVEKERDEKKTM